MKHRTHLIIGAAIAAPVALSTPPAEAAAIVSMGVAGATIPDFLDFKSDARRVLKHRGLSHSLLALVITVAIMWVIVGALGNAGIEAASVSAETTRRLVQAFGLGFLSHLVADACTRGGVPLLAPATRKRIRLLPAPLCGTTDGKIDTITRLGGVLMLALFTWIYAARY